MVVALLFGTSLHPVLLDGVNNADARRYRLFTMAPGFIEASFVEDGEGARVTVLLESDRTKEGWEERVVRMDAGDVEALNRYISSGNYSDGMADLSDLGAPIWESEVYSSSSCLYTGCSIPLGACLLGALSGYAGFQLTDNSTVSEGIMAAGTVAGGVMGYMGGRDADRSSALVCLREVKGTPSFSGVQAERPGSTGLDYEPRVRVPPTQTIMAGRVAISAGWVPPSGDIYSDSGRVRPLLSLSGRYTFGYRKGIRLGLGLIYLWSEAVRKDKEPFDRYTGQWKSHAFYGNLLLTHGSGQGRTYLEIGLALGLGQQYASFWDPIAVNTNSSSGIGLYSSLFGDITYGRFLVGFELGQGTGPLTRLLPNMNIHGGIGFGW